MTIFKVQARRMEQRPDNTWVCREEKQIEIHTTIDIEMLRITLAEGFGNWRPKSMWAIPATVGSEEIKSNNSERILRFMHAELDFGKTNYLDCYPIWTS